MTAAKVKKKVVGDRVVLIDQMLSEIRLLPLESFEKFVEDKRNIWSVESCLRRVLEALLDLGRHILAKSFGKGVTEYKEIATLLENFQVLTPEDGKNLRILAGYRNRMVHFYHEITPEELYRISRDHLDDVLHVKQAFIEWLRINPDKIDERL